MCAVDAAWSVPSRSGGGEVRRRNRHHRIHGKLNDNGLIMRMMTELQLAAPDTDTDSDEWSFLSSIFHMQDSDHAADTMPLSHQSDDLVDAHCVVSNESGCHAERVSKLMITSLSSERNGCLNRDMLIEPCRQSPPPQPQLT
jgi:hypothetical protein